MPPSEFEGLPHDVIVWNTPTMKERRGLLVIQPMVGSDSLGADTSVLGLPLVRRVVLSAKSAGFERIFVSARDVAGTREILHETPAIVIAAGEPVPTDGLPRIVVLAGNILPSQALLRDLREWRLESGQMEVESGAVAVIETDHGRQTLELPMPKVSDPLGLELCGLPAALDGKLRTRERQVIDGDSLVITPSTTRSDVEKHLLGGLVKDTDGFMARHFARPLSLALTRRLVATSVSANAMTVFSVLIGLLAAPFFLSSTPSVQLTGGLLFVLHSIVDGCDGELARLRFMESRFGGLLDYWGDNMVHVAVFSCMAVGWGIDIGASWPLWAGAAAVAGTLASAGFVYWRTMRIENIPGPVFTTVSRTDRSGLTKISDALARRDFIYLVVILAAFGKAAWFLALTAVGAPLFFVTLLVIAMKENKTSEIRILSKQAE